MDLQFHSKGLPELSFFKVDPPDRPLFLNIWIMLITNLKKNLKKVDFGPGSDFQKIEKSISKIEKKFFFFDNFTGSTDINASPIILYRAQISLFM